MAPHEDLSRAEYFFVKSGCLIFLPLFCDSLSFFAVSDIFTLHGEKLKGGWMLIGTKSQKNVPRPAWTLCKQADPFAAGRADKGVLEQWPNSNSTGRTMEEIVRDWTRRKDTHQRQTRLFG
jgi:hypothetical protein